jgi:hypothetical protein
MVRWKTRLAIVLWLILAFAVWNVIFDRVLVLAGRKYVHDAAVASRAGSYQTIDSAMRPAIRRGFWLASAVAVPIALFGTVAATLADRRHRRTTCSKNETERGSPD